MSHWTTVKTKINSSRALKSALTRMGLEYQTGDDLSISQYGTTEKAEIKLDNAVGFSKQEDGTFAMVGDFYHSENKKLSKYYGNTGQFQKDITQAYTIEQAIQRMKEQQFQIKKNPQGTVGADGKVTIVFQRY